MFFCLLEALSEALEALRFGPMTTVNILLYFIDAKRGEKHEIDRTRDKTGE